MRSFKALSLVLCFGICFLSAEAQFDPKSTSAVRCEISPKVDGSLADPAWLAAPVASGFVVDRPNPGKPSTFDTEVRVVYDDEAMYVAMMNFDPSPDSILAQLTGRDSDGNSDYCGVTFGCYRDGINGFTFAVSPTGEQFDAREGFDADGNLTEDVSWNAVWHCHTQILANGWTAEFRIPFAALRFPEMEEQLWDINFFKEIRRLREHSFWSGVDPGQAGFMTQLGSLTGVKNITPPMRLFFYPYASAYVDFRENGDGSPATRTTSYNGGMDVKLGLSEAFTLDATLIPDFGQTISDQLVLNVTPFEIQFAENRQFFTEGTELFSKGGIFYSRRIGSVNYDATLSPALGSSEYIISSPV
ncbi:MAG: carbohydrate binding family 9 domain-containing protein, partial [Flavobacteriales bacterium]|nr:carbohydrate binding family 9 domain-containing protein [Flavobacteriales bacterium]